MVSVSLIQIGTDNRVGNRVRRHILWAFFVNSIPPFFFKASHCVGRTYLAGDRPKRKRKV